MKFPRARLAAALTPILFGAAAAVVIARAPTPASPGTHLTAATTQAAVTIGCSGARQVHPGAMVLACADGNAYLSGLHWTTWGTAAYGSGTYQINGCVPSCAAGHFHSFPALVMLWRAEPLPRHHGMRYYTRITLALPGPHCYPAGGKRTCYPASYTGTLWSTTSGGLPVRG